MTLLVGIRCTDGVVIAADRAVTFGSPQSATISHLAKKVTVISDQVIVAGTGQVGLGQRFAHQTEQLWKSSSFGKTPIEAVNKVANASINDFRQTDAPKGQFGALLAFPMRNQTHLVEFAVSDMQPEMKDDGAWFVSMGSGQAIADPYLAFIRDALWEKGPPDITAGKLAAAWVMKRAISASPGFVAEPIDIATLSQGKGSSPDLCVIGDAGVAPLVRGYAA